MEFRSWDQLSELEQLQSTYSDFHKDVHGFRPRCFTNEEWNSVEYFKKAIADLELVAKVVWEEEAKREKENIAKFEARVATVIEAGAGDRETAIRWIMDAEEEYIRTDIGQFCYEYGLPYDYFKKVNTNSAVSV